jgi:hypothetical protein
LIIDGLFYGLWCLTPLSTIFQLYRGGQFYWWRKPECPEKTKLLQLVILFFQGATPGCHISLDGTENNQII